MTREGRDLLAAEMLDVLIACPDESFTAAELMPVLRSYPGWGAQLQPGLTGEASAAAIRDFLGGLGLGSGPEYRTSPARAQLQRALAEAAGTGPDSPASVVVMPPPDETEPGAPPRHEGQRRHGDPSTPGASASPAPLIRWRRRESDDSRRARERAAARPAPPPAGASPDPQAAAADDPPQLLWMGGGRAFPAPPPAAPLAYGAAPGAAGEAEPSLPLGFYWHQVRRHALKIVLGAACVTLATGFYTLRIPKRYDAVATLRMDFRSPMIQADANSNPAFDPATLIQTEIADITQRSVILDAIHTAHLDQDASLRRQLQGAPDPPATAADPDADMDALVNLVSDQTTALQPDNTHNLEIHFESLDPASAATVANALGAALIHHEFQTRQQEENDALQFMNRQFADIQARVEQEQADLLRYQHQNDILNPDGESSLQSSTLAALNGSYLATQSDLTRYQAEENILRAILSAEHAPGPAPARRAELELPDPPPGATTSGTRGKAALGPAPEISGTPAAALGPAREANALLASDEGAMLRPSYEAWQAAQLAFQLMRTTRGPANPAYQAAQLALNNAQAQLGAAVASVREQIDSKYQRALDQMTLVSRQLAAARIAAQNFNEKEIDYDTRKRNLDADQKLYDGLRTQIKQQQLMASASSSALRITNPATPDPDPVSPNLSYNLALALLASVFGGCGVAVLAGYLDSSFTSPQGVEQYLHLPLLGALPAVADQEQLMVQARPAPPDTDAGPDPADPAASPFTEAILMLRTAVLAAAPQGLRTLSITSAESQEGKSIVLANLAMALALHGAKVLLVDADVRRPRLHRLFNAPNRRGLSDLLRQETGLEECLFHTGIKKLYLLPAGAAVANPGELIGTMLPHLLPPVSAEFDYVLFDSPPMLGYADAVAVATSVEGTLLVARAGKTPRDAVQAALVPLQRARARVLGLVLNQITRSMSPYYAYHRDHYARYLRRA